MVQELLHLTRLTESLLSRFNLFESDISNLKQIIQEKVNPANKEFVDDDDLLDMFGITKNIRYKMIADGALKQYKLRGKMSTSLYRYSEVTESIEKGLINPKSNFTNGSK